jgi:antitoxin (DNA-binding transcriptional repressor) of toxin-antitoxin stability system
MKTRISATRAAREFSELLNRVYYRGESFIVDRGGKPVCEISPARRAEFTGADLAELLRSAPRPDDEYLDVVEKLARSQKPVAKSPWRR